VFHYDRGLKLTKNGLAIDFTRRQPRAFISHAHTDHMARHEYALCTPETARLYHHRLGRRPVREMPYRETIEWGGLRLTAYPAGHCLGSAMLLADDGQTRLLYTGDFKLGPKHTAAEAELPRADILVIECTYGRPEYRHTPRAEAVARLLALVRETIAGGATPVIQAYVVGKAQEVTRILTTAGLRVLQHPDIHAVSQIYADCGVELGEIGVFRGQADPGTVVVVPPMAHRGTCLNRLPRMVTFAVSGWAMDRSARYRLGVDHAIPLSDHADYDELFEAVALVQPSEVYCTHGPESFVDRLAAAGWNARPLRPSRQLRLF
jgi:Cft2 family RNA processing exonuclease